MGQQTFSLQCCAAEGDLLACKRFYTVSQHMEVDDFTSRLTTDEYIALMPLWHPISLFLYIFFPQILYMFYNTIFIPAVIQGWALPRWVLTPAPGLHGREGWLGENQTQDWNHQSPGENRTRDWTSTVQRANHWATLHPTPLYPLLQHKLWLRSLRWGPTQSSHQWLLPFLAK